MVSARFRYDIGDRIAHDNADDRRQEGDPKRFTDDAQKRRIGDKSRKVFEREFKVDWQNFAFIENLILTTSLPSIVKA